MLLAKKKSVVVILALVLASGLRGDGPAKGTEFYQDFRGGKELHPSLKWDGRDEDVVAEPEQGGLRIKLPAARMRGTAVGLLIAAPVRGDFEITAGYEILQADESEVAFATGFELYVMTTTPAKDAIAFTRGKRINVGDAYACGRMTTPTGKGRQYKWKVFPSTAKAGRLRMVRTGGEVTLSASEEGAADFRELCRYDLGTEDLKMVRVAALPGAPMQPVEVRLVDLRVRTPSPVAALAPDAGPSAEGPKKEVSKGWLVTVEIVGLIITLVLAGLGVWLYLRRREAEEDGTAEVVAAEEVPEFVSFACSGCGRKSRAKAALAGKKAKCPQCGGVVVVPVSSSDRASD